MTKQITLKNRYIYLFGILILLLAYTPVIADEAVKLNEDSLYERARTLVDNYQGNTKSLYEAQEILNQILEYNPNYAKAYVGLARMYSAIAFNSRGQSGEKGLEQALTYLSKALDINPDLFEAHVTKAYIYISLEDIERAKRSFESAEKIKPYSARINILRAKIALKEGHYDIAIKEANKGLNKTDYKPYKKVALRTIGEVSWHNKDYDGMDKMHKQLVDLYPNSPWMKNNYGAFLISMREYDKAIAQLKEALEIMSFGMAHKNLSEAYYWKGAQYFWEIKEPENAIEYFTLSLENDPNNVNSYYGIGSYYISKFKSSNKFEEKCDYLYQAEENFQKMLEIEPGNKTA